MTSEATRKRLDRAERALAPEDEPRELKFEFEARTFESHAALFADGQARDAARRKYRGPEAVDLIRVTIVSIAKPGEPVGVRPIGQLPATKAKRTIGVPLTAPPW